jgi:hypothetical protein
VVSRVRWRGSRRNGWNVASLNWKTDLAQSLLDYRDGIVAPGHALPQTLHRSLFLDPNKMCLPRQEKPAPERTATARAASARTLRSKTSDLKACGPPGGGATRQAPRRCAASCPAKSTITSAARPVHSGETTEKSVVRTRPTSASCNARCETDGGQYPPDEAGGNHIESSGRSCAPSLWPNAG